MIGWFQQPPKKAARWDGYVWHSQRRPAAAVSFYLSPEWRELRAAEIAANKEWYGRKIPTCERCGVHRKYRVVVRRFTWFRIPFPARELREWHGDHIYPRSTHPGLELDPDNIQILCAQCNYAKSNVTTHNWKAWRRYPFKVGYLRVWVVRSHQRVFLGWSA